MHFMYINSLQILRLTLSLGWSKLVPDKTNGKASGGFDSCPGRILSSGIRFVLETALAFSYPVFSPFAFGTKTFAVTVPYELKNNNNNNKTVKIAR
jgi:hypothetical protein